MAKTKTAAEAYPAILERYGNSLMAGDPDQWIANWTEDCVQLPPGGPMVVGKRVLYDSISAWLGAYTVADFKTHGDLEVQEAGDWEAAGRLLAGDARALEEAGADLILLCTNTMHRVADAIEEAVTVPFLHLADATARAVKEAGISVVALLGTPVDGPKGGIGFHFIKHGCRDIVVLQTGDYGVQSTDFSHA